MIEQQANDIPKHSGGLATGRCWPSNATAWGGRLRSFRQSAFQAQAKHGPGDRWPVLVHGQFLREDQVDSFKEHGVVRTLLPM